MKTAFILFFVLGLALSDVSHLNGIHTVLQEDGYHYDKPNVAFPPRAQPLCDNGASDSTYPHCCLNGLTVPGCQRPTPPPPPPPPQVRTQEDYLPPPPPQRSEPQPLCDNGASDDTYPHCCLNGLRVPGCQPPAPPPPPPPQRFEPEPLCANGASDSTYPHCCLNGLSVPGCQQPTQPPRPPPQVRTQEDYLPPPPQRSEPEPLCANGASDDTYPHCCLNGLRVPGCQPPAPPPPPPQRIEPQPLCDNGASDSTYPHCCLNGLRVPGCQPPAPPQPRPQVRTQDEYLPPCGNGGSGPNCDTSSGYDYNRPQVAFVY